MSRTLLKIVKNNSADDATFTRFIVGGRSKVTGMGGLTTRIDMKYIVHCSKHNFDSKNCFRFDPDNGGGTWVMSRANITSK